MARTIQQAQPKPVFAAELTCGQPIRILNLGNDIVVGEGSEQMVGYRQMLFHLLHGAGHDVSFVGEFQDEVSDTFPEKATWFQAESSTTIDLIADNVFAWATAYQPDIILLHAKNSPTNQGSEDFARLLSELARYETENSTAVFLYVARTINQQPSDSEISEQNDAVETLILAEARDDRQMVDLESSLDYVSDMSSGTQPNDAGYGKLARRWAATLRNDATLAMPRCLPLALNQTAVSNATISGQPVTHQFELINLTNSVLTDVSLTVEPSEANCSFSTLLELNSGLQQRLSCQTSPTAPELLFATISGTHPVSGTVINNSIGFVGIVEASLIVSKTTSTPIILNGATANYTITLTNDGDLPLSLSLSDPGSNPACVNDAPDTLDAGATANYPCTSIVQTADFTSTLTVTGTYTVGETVGQIVETSSVPIDVINPAITIVSHGPAMQSVPFGETAVFSTTIQNSGDVPLTDLHLVYEETSACDAAVTQLAVGESQTFRCEEMNVTREFNNPVTVTAIDPLENELMISNTSAFVDLIPLITLNKTAVPEQLPEPGGLVTYSLELINPTNEALSLISLTNVTFGDLLDVTNTAVFNNSCPSLAAVPPDETISCQFTANIVGAPGDITNQTIVTVADDDGNDTIQDNDSATLTITNLPPTLDVTFSASPTRLEAPGGRVTFSLTVKNSSAVDTVLLTSIIESGIGNLFNEGLCQTPSTLAISAVYQCEYQVELSGLANEAIPISLAVNGLDEEKTAVSETAALMVTITPPNQYLSFLPVITHLYRSSDEPNNDCQTAFPLDLGTPYQFFPNDVNDWYRFEFAGGNLTITLEQFSPEIGQVILWRGQCGSLELIANNGNNQPEKVIQQPNLPAGSYAIWIISDGPKSNTIPYRLTISE